MTLVSTYQQDKFLSMPKEQILLQLYDGLLRRLQDAETLLSQGDQKQASQAIGKSLAIVNALREALDFNVGAEAAPLLDQLYGTVSHWLLQANLEQNTAHVTSSRQVVSLLKEGWDGAVAQVA